jgi:hypothetical protein
MNSEIFLGVVRGVARLQLHEVYNFQCHSPHFCHETPSFRQYDEKVAHLDDILPQDVI